MSAILTWTKNNKLAAFLLLVVAFLLLRGSFLGLGTRISYESDVAQDLMAPAVSSNQKISTGGIIPPPETLVPPAPEVKNRLVIQESNLSLLVKDANQTLQAIQDSVVALEGYLVSSSLSRPQDAVTGTIIVRVPQEKFKEALDYFRSLAVKVVSENLQGFDVTDEYVDIDARLAVLQRNKVRFEEIMTKAEKIEDILAVQREIMNLQDQIDNLVGQQKYLEKSAQMAKITLYLSTDELSLPYTPSQPWRPEVIFKLAVRSLIGNLQRIGSLLIWLGVYSVIWLPLLIIIWFLLRRKSKMINNDR